MAATFNAEPLPGGSRQSSPARPSTASVGGAAPSGGVAADGAVAAHEAAADPHPIYETAAEVNDKVAAHTVAADPHGDRAYANTTFALKQVSATQRLLGRNSASAGPVEEVTLTQLLDWIGSPARGDILYRGASGWARLPAGTAGQVLRTNGPAANPSWVKGPGVVGAGVFHSASQTLTNGVALFPAFNSERFDTDNCHDNVTNNSRLTCRTAGIYVIVGNVQISANATGSRDLSIRLNGTNFIAGVRFAAAATGATQAQIQAIYQLAVNDYIELGVTQTSGVSLSLETVASYTPEFRMALVGTI